MQHIVRLVVSSLSVQLSLAYFTYYWSRYVCLVFRPSSKKNKMDFILIYISELILASTHMKAKIFKLTWVELRGISLTIRFLSPLIHLGFSIRSFASGLRTTRVILINQPGFVKVYPWIQHFSLPVPAFFWGLWIIFSLLAGLNWSELEVAE